MLNFITGTVKHLSGLIREEVKVRSSSLLCKTWQSAISHLTVDIKRSLHTLKHIHQYILLPKFHENRTLPEGVKSCLGADSEMESSPLVTSNFYKTFQGVSGVSLQVYKEFFRYLLSTLRYGTFSQGKLKSPTLNLRHHTFAGSVYCWRGKCSPSTSR